MIDAVAVDTDVISFFLKQDTRASSYRQHIEGKLLVVSFMTLAELERWALQRNWSEARRDGMAEFLKQFVMQPADRSLCRHWAEITDGARRQGRVVHCADAWVAATALQHQIPLITHNSNDFIGINGLQVISASS